MAHKFLPDSRKLSDYEGSVLRVPVCTYRCLDRAVQIYFIYYTEGIKAQAGRFYSCQKKVDISAWFFLISGKFLVFKLPRQQNREGGGSVESTGHW